LELIREATVKKLGRELLVLPPIERRNDEDWQEHGKHSGIYVGRVLNR